MNGMAADQGRCLISSRKPSTKAGPLATISTTQLYDKTDRICWRHETSLQAAVVRARTSLFRTINWPLWSMYGMILNSAGILFYVTTRVTASLTFVWRQAVQRSPLLKFAVSRGPRAFVRCMEVGIFFPVAQGLIIEASRSRSVGLLWTSDKPNAQTCTWQHATLTRNRHPCFRQDWNPQSQQVNGRRPRGNWDRLDVNVILYYLK
jgi:hypothetical protein